jgi:long-subunit acyl-CoA synthetase (AMP-forming)
MRLEKSPLVEQSCVTGAALSQPIALVILSALATEVETAELKEQLLNHLKEINSQIEAWEKLSTLVILKENWTVENGLLTPTMKMKRNKVEEKYQRNIEKWGNSKELIQFV